MTDVKVTQADRANAAAIASNGINHTLTASIIAGKEDKSWLVLKTAQFRQAAEKAQQERDAGVADAHRQARLEAAKNAHARKVKAEARDHESMAIEALHIATAIRSQGHE